MTENKIVSLRQEGAINDPLTEILRAGAKRLIAQAVEAEFAAFLGSHEDKALPDGRQRVVRHGHDPDRVIQTGIGPVEVRKPKARDRGASPEGERIRFSSSILPHWARRTKSLDALLPALYLRGVSAGDFQEALAALLGKEAANLSPSVISRLKGEWEGEYERWRKRDLSARRYVYLWADGVYLQARMEPQAECMLVLIGATPEGDGVVVGDGPVQVDAYIDFLCPFCRRFEVSSGPTLTALVTGHQIRIAYHPMNFLDQASTTRYSTRAAAASGAWRAGSPHSCSAVR